MAPIDGWLVGIRLLICLVLIGDRALQADSKSASAALKEPLHQGLPL